MQVAPADLMEAFAVSTAVNRAGRDVPEMVEPLAPESQLR
jgi:hypothetical protein